MLTVAEEPQSGFVAGVDKTLLIALGLLHLDVAAHPHHNLLSPLLPRSAVVRA
jgi:hypothetical protein